MSELPRACFVADRLARDADFFPLGTNDLTQTAIGLSREDVEGRMLPGTIDVEGVAELVRLAIERGRRTRPDLEVGICGEHGGDPDSIGFVHVAGLDSTSCSPFRVPLARVAAAQAAIAGREA